jgi:hypothetical protein
MFLFVNRLFICRSRCPFRVYIHSIDIVTITENYPTKQTNVMGCFGAEGVPPVVEAQYRDNLRWIREAGQHHLVVGSQARILYSDRVGRILLALAFNCAVTDGLLQVTLIQRSRGSSVGIALGYGLGDRGSRVRFSAGAGNFSLHHRVQNGSGARQASYPTGTRGSFPGDKAAGAWNWPLTSIQCRGQRMSGAIPPLPQYAFMAWCSVKAQGQLYLYSTLVQRRRVVLEKQFSSFHHRVHKRRALDPILSQINPIHTVISYFFKDPF